VHTVCGAFAASLRRLMYHNASREPSAKCHETAHSGFPVLAPLEPVTRRVTRCRKMRLCHISSVRGRPRTVRTRRVILVPQAPEGLGFPWRCKPPTPLCEKRARSSCNRDTLGWWLHSPRTLLPANGRAASLRYPPVRRDLALAVLTQVPVKPGFGTDRHFARCTPAVPHDVEERLDVAVQTDAAVAHVPSSTTHPKLRQRSRVGAIGAPCV